MKSLLLIGPFVFRFCLQISIITTTHGADFTSCKINNL